VIALLLASVISGEGSGGVRDAILGAMVGVGAVLAVVGLWMAGSKKINNK